MSGRFETVVGKREDAHKSAIWCCRFGGTEDGQNKFLATGAADDSIAIWSVVPSTTRNISRDSSYELDCRHMISGHHAHGIIDLDVSSDNSRMSSCSADSRINVWDTTTFERVMSLPRSTKPPLDLPEPFSAWMCAFSPDGKVIATASLGGKVDLYALDCQRKVASFATKSRFISSIHPSPDGRYLACGGQEGCVSIFDMAACKFLTSLEDHAMCVRAMRYSPDGKILATGADDGLVKLYRNYNACFSDSCTLSNSTSSSNTHNVGAPSASSTLPGQSGWILSLDFDASSNYLAASTSTHTVKTWVMRQEADTDEADKKDSNKENTRGLDDDDDDDDDDEGSGSMSDRMKTIRAYQHSLIEFEDEEEAELIARDWKRTHDDVHQGFVWAVSFDRFDLCGCATLASAGDDKSIVLYE